MSENPFAFPRPMSKSAASYLAAQQGMTLRDWFAGQALAGVVTTCGGDTEVRKIGAENHFAAQAYRIADAMLHARAIAQKETDNA